MSGVRLVLLDEICHFEKGSTSLMKASPGDYPLVNTGSERRTCDLYQFDTKAVCIPLVSSTGHGHASLNNVHYQEGKFALGTILVAITAKNEEELDVHFLHLYLSQLKDIILVPLMKGAANVSLSIKAIKNIEIPLPTLAKQREVIKKFKSIEKEEISLNQELDLQNLLLEKLRVSLIDDAITGKLTLKWRNNKYTQRPSKNGEVSKNKIYSFNEDSKFELPSEWQWFSLDELTYITRGSSPRPISAFITDKSEGVNWIKIGDTKGVGKTIFTTHQKITKEGAEKSQFVEVGDFILSNSMSYGKPYIMGVEGYIHDGWFLIKLLGDINIDYFYYLLLSNLVQDQFKEKASGAVVKNIRAEIVKKTRLAIPPLEEQKEIVSKIEMILHTVSDLSLKINESRSHSKRLMESVLLEEFSQ